MSESSEYLVISRGQWDEDASKEDIEVAINKFYNWLEQNIDGGRMKMGSRLKRDCAVVSKKGVTDGPFGEGKEVIGGYWTIVARNLREAANLAAQNPCVQYGLTFEIRPLEPERASVYKPANETPVPSRA
jgi:hypothetical protein